MDIIQITGIIYLIIINIAGLSVMGIDKRRAVRHVWRVPEKTIFLISLLGGSLGAWSGMYLFRHKTRHWYFVMGLPLILILQIAVAVLGVIYL